MKTCIPGCEFMLSGYCNLHKKTLGFWSYETGPEAGKIVYTRCKECEEEKEELDVIEDLKALEELYDENKGISDVTETERREQLLKEIDGRRQIFVRPTND